MPENTDLVFDSLVFSLKHNTQETLTEAISVFSETFFLGMCINFRKSRAAKTPSH